MRGTLDGSGGWSHSALWHAAAPLPLSPKSAETRPIDDRGAFNFSLAAVSHLRDRRSRTTGSPPGGTRGPTNHLPPPWRSRGPAAGRTSTGLCGDPEWRGECETSCRPAASWNCRPRTCGARSDPPASARRPGTVIGPYKLLEQIGEGGFGVVFMAEQTAAGPPQGRPEGAQAGHGHAAGGRPLRGRAAGPGDHGPPEHRQGVRRRRHRRRAGPYFVMELVKGVPITDFCDQNHLTPRRAAGAVRHGLPGGAARPPEGDHPPRPQAVQRPGHAARRRRRWSR